MIGELSRQSGRSVHAIRWYEKEGLIPAVRRDNGNRRVYGEFHVGWLELIDRLRHTGMPIAEIRHYVALVKAGGGTLKQRQTLLAEHGQRVRERIDELNQALMLIDDKIEFYEEWSVTGRRPDRKMGARGKQE